MRCGWGPSPAAEFAKTPPPQPSPASGRGSTPVPWPMVGLSLTISALSAGPGFLQEIRAVHRRVIVDRDQVETDLGQHPLHDPAEGRIFVAHMGDDTVALEIVVLDLEVGPLLDVALAAVG